MPARAATPTADERGDGKRTAGRERSYALVPSPAQQWVEALPVGNGRLGAMVFGGVERERLQLNEDTLWTGGPRDWNNPNAPKALAEVRPARRRGEVRRTPTVQPTACKGPYTQSYAPLGDLVLTFEHGDAWRGYRRQLDLQSAIAAVRYRIGDTNYVREVIASHPDQAIVVRTLGRPAGDDHLHRHARQPAAARRAAGRRRAQARRRAPAHADPSYFDSGKTPIVYRDDDGMSFEAQPRRRCERRTSWVDRAGLHVRGADEVVLRLAAATSFNGYDKHPVREEARPGPLAAAQLRAASAKPWPCSATRTSPRTARCSTACRSSSCRPHRPRSRRRTCPPTSASTPSARRISRWSAASSSTGATC
jgi:alpha-L-fucosidase 2